MVYYEATYFFRKAVKYNFVFKCSFYIIFNHYKSPPILLLSKIIIDKNVYLVFMDFSMFIFY